MRAKGLWTGFGGKGDQGPGQGSSVGSRPHAHAVPEGLKTLNAPGCWLIVMERKAWQRGRGAGGAAAASSPSVARGRVGGMHDALRSNSPPAPLPPNQWCSLSGCGQARRVPGPAGQDGPQGGASRVLAGVCINARLGVRAKIGTLKNYLAQQLVRVHPWEVRHVYLHGCAATFVGVRAVAGAATT